MTCMQEEWRRSLLRWVCYATMVSALFMMYPHVDDADVHIHGDMVEYRENMAEYPRDVQYNWSIRRGRGSWMKRRRRLKTFFPCKPPLRNLVIYTSDCLYAHRDTCYNVRDIIIDKYTLTYLFRDINRQEIDDNIDRFVEHPRDR